MVDKPKYVDVNVFIYWLGGHPLHGKKSRKWIRKIEKAAPREYMTSSLTIYETLIIHAGLTGRNMRDIEFVRRIIEAFERLKGLAIEPLKREDMAQAIELMDKYQLDYEDALHLTTALKAGATIVISNDKDWDKTPIPRTF
ncbi:MAG: VapC toxin family PIN domain ribonuclease [Thermoprotei archaeon]|nr:MAG: VapC toxin family PIN domain ribonuclease [Thermoprotei archaeon]